MDQYYGDIAQNNNTANVSRKFDVDGFEQSSVSNTHNPKLILSHLLQTDEQNITIEKYEFDKRIAGKGYDTFKEYIFPCTLLLVIRQQ